MRCSNWNTANSSKYFVLVAPWHGSPRHNRCGERSFYGVPSFGSPFDLRGYYWGKYRDKTMAYGILEYRHMFGSVEKYKSGNFWAKCGFVGWVGTGTIGNAPIVDWNKWKFNYGVGLRIQMQPGKNFRLDVGKDPNQKGMAVYMNMTEAF